MRGIGGQRPQWLEVSEAALIHNLGLLRRLVGAETKIAAVVKANAYGHGMDEVAPIAAREADWLAVHTAKEARRIRRLGLNRPVLIMGFVPESEFFDLDDEIHIFVSTVEVIEWLGRFREKTGTSLPIHLKVDTGTKRQGIEPERIPELCRAAADRGLEVVGIATHFANIEDTIEHHFARHQLEKFDVAVEVLRRHLGGDVPFIHAACSAATLLFRETDFTLSRVGISLYGHWPSRETQLTWILDHGRGGFQLEPVLTWRALVGQIQDVQAGETVGYGRTWTALRATRLAVIPVGYADGYTRSLGNRARVLIHGQTAPVVGRVCMNIMMVDVSDIPDVGVGDDVVLLGRQGDSEVSVEELAELSETINYEFLARISPEIPRIVVSDGDTA